MGLIDADERRNRSEEEEDAENPLHGHATGTALGLGTLFAESHKEKGRVEVEDSVAEEKRVQARL